MQFIVNQSCPASVGRLAKARRGSIKVASLDARFENRTASWAETRSVRLHAGKQLVLIRVGRAAQVDGILATGGLLLRCDVELVSTFSGTFRPEGKTRLRTHQARREEQEIRRPRSHLYPYRAVFSR